MRLTHTNSELKDFLKDVPRETFIELFLEEHAKYGYMELFGEIFTLEVKYLTPYPDSNAVYTIKSNGKSVVSRKGGL